MAHLRGKIMQMEAQQADECSRDRSSDIKEAMVAHEEHRYIYSKTCQDEITKGHSLDQHMFYISYIHLFL